MRREASPNADLFCLYIVARAWVFDRQCRWVLDAAEDDRGEYTLVSPEVAAAVLYKCGVSAQHIVDPSEEFPEEYWFLAAAGSWVLVWVKLPAPAVRTAWAILDWCPDHGRRLLYWDTVGGEPLWLEPGDLRWRHHVVLIPANRKAPNHVQKGLPSLN